MAVGEVGNTFGNYRIEGLFFPAPVSGWIENPLGVGLNGIPVLSSYRIHTWSWPQLEAILAKELFAKFESQQTNNSQLALLETDPYDASTALDKYGTVEYTDFIIISVGTRSRNFPNYDGVEVTFEVYVAG